MLDLDGSHPPTPPSHATELITLRLPVDLAAWVRDTAHVENTTPVHVLRSIVAAARGDRWPPDVQRWLAAQAACTGAPGDIDHAVITVVRHLAARWPNGARLHD